jgi:hypothetical protein
MFKIILRHIILEQCASVFFDKIVDNFIKPILKPFLLKAHYTLEPADDIMIFHGESVYKDFMKYLRKEIEQELDAEILGRMRQSAKNIYQK